MTQDTKNDEDQWSGPPYIVYRNPEDDVVRTVLQQVVKERREKGLPVFEYPHLKE